MKSLTLHLGPVYSRLADVSDTQGLDLMKIPEQWRHRLRCHQAQAWQAYKNSDAQVIFDTALTGDGKSLAGQLPMLADDRFALLLYPTNELIRDQVKQVERYLTDFGRKRSHQVVYSERITEEVEKYDGTLSRSSALMGWIKSRDYILSNPDLFHLMSSYNYGSDQAKRDFAYQIPANFQYLIVILFKSYINSTTGCTVRPRRRTGLVRRWGVIVELQMMSLTARFCRN